MISLRFLSWSIACIYCQKALEIRRSSLLGFDRVDPSPKKDRRHPKQSELTILNVWKRVILSYSDWIWPVLHNFYSLFTQSRCALSKCADHPESTLTW